MSENTFKMKVYHYLNELGDLLVKKNKAYGNSALEPIRIFSQASPREQLLVRIDDKLSRIVKGHQYQNEDTITDLIGYLVLLKIAIQQEKENEYWSKIKVKGIRDIKDIVDEAFRKPPVE